MVAKYLELVGWVTKRDPSNFRKDDPWWKGKSLEASGEIEKNAGLSFWPKENDTGEGILDA